MLQRVCCLIGRSRQDFFAVSVKVLEQGEVGCSHFVFQFLCGVLAGVVEHFYPRWVFDFFFVDAELEYIFVDVRGIRFIQVEYEFGYLEG